MSLKSEREPKRRKLNPWLVRGGAAFLVGSAAIGGVGSVACNGETQFETPTPTATPHRSPESISKEAVADLYQTTDDLTTHYFEKERSGMSIGALRMLARGITDVKADFISSASPEMSEQYFSIKHLEDKTVIVIQGREFDISNNSTDFVIGTALTDYFFQEQFADELSQKFEFFNFDRQTLDDINNLLWLKDNFEEIELGDLPPIARTANLEELAIGLKALQEAGLSIPHKAKISVLNYGDNPYKGTDNDTIFLDVYSYPTGEFRVGSSIAEFLMANNPKILEGYSEVVSEAFSQNQNQITEPRLISSFDYGYLYGDDAAEFSIFFSDYIFEGEGLRKKIAYANATGHFAEAAILETKSGYVQQLVGGRDYSVDGRTKKVIRDYQVGEVIEIDDYERPRKSGIFLRQEPTLEIDPNWPITFDRQPVKLVGKPKVILNDRDLEATTFWQVQTGDIASGRVFVADQRTPPGWVSQEWFGAPAEINQ